MPTQNALSLSRARPSFADAREIDDFVETLHRFERHELDADEWRAYRVGRGAYSQRQSDVHMLRVKLPQGVATADQLSALADVIARHASGFGHVTTRQNVQVYFVSPTNLEAALRRLAEAGITTSGAGGNTVRNVVSCPFAGVSADEVFDPTPYAEAVTRHFLRHPLASTLPRKFKIAFEGCRSTDHVKTATHDLGFHAVLREEGGTERRGFSVVVGGGTSTACTSGAPLLDFLPAAEILVLSEAIVRVFHSRGDRKNKHRNRLKFLLRDVGLEPFRALVEETMETIRREGAPLLPFDPAKPPVEAPPTHERPAPPSLEDIAASVLAASPRPSSEHETLKIDLAPSSAARASFLRTNARPQRQPGYSVISVAPPQGDITAAQLDALAQLALAYGDGAVRLGNDGHLHLRWVREGDLTALHAALAAAGLARDGAGSAADVVACPGAEVCRQSVTRTRDVARLIEERLRGLGPNALKAKIPVHISGCPHGCSQHHVAAIGLQGSARRLGNGTIPQYFVLLGGSTEPGRATFGRIAAKVPARRIAEAVERLVSLYLAERNPNEEAGPFFARAFEQAQALLAPLGSLGVEDARAEDFVEPGTREEFRPDIQEGECAA